MSRGEKTTDWENLVLRGKRRRRRGRPKTRWLRNRTEWFVEHTVSRGLV